MHVHITAVQGGCWRDIPGLFEAGFHKKRNSRKEENGAYGPEERGDRPALQAEPRKATEPKDNGERKSIFPGRRKQRAKKATKSRERFGKSES